MKKIINGKKYDTNTAEKLGEYQYGTNRRDFTFFREILYRKTVTGEFFLYGEGGPKSKYANQIGQNWWESGEKIIPLLEKDAREWAKKNMTGDEYKAAFGTVAV